MDKQEIDTSTHTKRESSLDFIRGVTVLLMIVTHALYFFHDESSTLFNIIARTGNVICFTVFLYVSGVSLYLGFLQDTPLLPEKKKKLWKRSLYILFGYYLVALVARIDNLTELQSIVPTILKVLSLQDTPSFTEFLLPFVFFSLSIIPFARIYRYLSKNIIFTLLISASLFTVGYLLYPLTPNSPWREIKALFVGDPSIIRFPFLQYAPVFMFGLFSGNFLAKTPATEKRERTSFNTSIIFLIMIVIFSFGSRLYPFVLLEPLRRWPPSITFILIGIFSAVVLHVLYTNIIKTKALNMFWRILNYIGKDAFDLFIFHILALFIYKLIWEVKYSSIITVFLLTLGLVILSIFLSSLNWRTSPSIFKLGPVSMGKSKSYRIKKRHVVIATVFILISLWNLNLTQNTSVVGDSINPSDIINPGTTPLPTITNNTIDAQEFFWFDVNYTYVRQIKVQNTSAYFPIESGEAVTISTQLKLLHNDLALVYLTSDEKYQPVPFIYDQDSVGKTIIKFQVQEKIYPDQFDNRYFVYFISDLPQPVEGLADSTVLNKHFAIEVGSELTQTIHATINKTWYLIDPPSFESTHPLILTATLRDTTYISKENLVYAVENTEISGNMEQYGGNTYQSIIDTFGLNPGIYYVRVYDKTKPSTVTGKRLKFHISYPVYVAWTLDWEGWDVRQNYLEAIDAQVTKHNNIPLTHFFNPRIYLPSVLSTERSSYLTQWVKNRKTTYGDEIALHLHMHYDLLNEVGIETKDTPNWSNYQDGYDVLTTTYSHDDLVKLLQWSQAQFEAHGLGKPAGYRAGGWFADVKVLQALEDTGFLYDSSGREKEMWGGTLKSPWDLTVTSQPFVPSKEDQNKTGDPSFALLEIPNNGGDSWAYDGQELLQRLDKNFNGSPVYQKTAITFLSHPQWFLSPDSLDRDKMEVVLTNTDKFLYSNDTGPVFYVTLQEIYNQWTN